VLVLGGTDVNVYMAGGAIGQASHPTHATTPDAAAAEPLAVIDRMLAAAAAVVAFSGGLAEGVELFAAHRGLCPRLAVIPQGVLVPGGPDGGPPVASVHDVLQLPRGTPVVLHVAGLRPVKDPLFVVAAFQQWRQRLVPTSSDGHFPVLVLVGPALDPATSAATVAGGCHGVFVLPALHEV